MITPDQDKIIKKDGKVYHNGKCYTEQDMALLDEIGKILTILDPTSSYDPKTKRWRYKEDDFSPKSIITDALGEDEEEKTQD